jgi:hypothetical protein
LVRSKIKLMSFLKKMKDKIYVVRKYVKATSAKDAILKEKKCEVDDVWLDCEEEKVEGFKNDNSR